MRLRKKQRKGYTLIELTVVIILVILIATTLTGMLTQQVNFIGWWRSQNFIAEDAPLVNNVVTRLFSKADGFKIYGNLAAAETDAAAGTTVNGTAMRLSFTDGSGVKTAGVLEYTGNNAPVNSLRFHVLNAAGNASASSWVVASGLGGANFVVSPQGIMLLTLTGPNGGQVTYAATSTL